MTGLVRRSQLGRVGTVLMLIAAVVALAGVTGGVPVAQASRPASIPAGTITTVAGGPGGPAPATRVTLSGSGSAPCRLAVAAGAVYLGDGATVRRIGPQNWLTTPAGSGAQYGLLHNGRPAPDARLWSACGVAVDAAGNLVITEGFAEEVQVVAARTGTFYGRAMTARHIYVVAGTGVKGFSGDGGPATSAQLDYPCDVTVDHSGNLVFVDDYNQRIRVVAAATGTFYGQAMTAGDIYTVAGDGGIGFSGDGGPATAAEFFYPGSVVVDGHGNLVITDGGNNRVRVVAEKTGTFYGQAMTAGDIYTVAGDGGTGFSGDGGPATAAEFFYPEDATVDAHGNLVIADTNNSRVRVVAATNSTFYRQAMTAGDIYTVAGNGVLGFSGDGGPAVQAALGELDGIAVDPAGNLVIADTGNGRVRVVAAKTGTFYGQAMTAGDIYTIAGVGQGTGTGDGGPATGGVLSWPAAVTFDAAGNLLVADASAERVRVVAAATGTFYGQAMTAGDIYTIAGGGTRGFDGDGSLGTAAELDAPSGVAVTLTGGVLIADTENDRIRMITP